MFFLRGVKLMLFILADSVIGNITPLQCYECSKCDNCSNAPLTSCFTDQDACAIVASWDGDPRSDMQISKRCDSLSHWPRDSVNGSATHCDKTENGIRCVMFCTDNGCNSGAIGSFPRPPPPPPLPEYKVAHCAGSEQGCKTSAVVEGDVINVRKVCGKSPMSKEMKTTSEINQCNVENKTDICVTCCNQDCYKIPYKTSNSQRITPHIFASMCLGLLTHYLLIQR